MCFKRTYTEHIHKQEEGSNEQRPKRAGPVPCVHDSRHDDTASYGLRLANRSPTINGGAYLCEVSEVSELSRLRLSIFFFVCVNDEIHDRKL